MRSRITPLGGWLFLVVAAATVHAQDAGVPAAPKASNVARLIQLLSADDPCGRAFSGLLLLGRPAAAAATAVIVRDAAKAPTRQFSQCLALLAELGPDATESLDALFTTAAGVEGETKRQILDTFLSIAPHTKRDAANQVRKAHAPLHTLMSDTSNATLQELAAETWFRCVQIGNMEDLPLSAGLLPDQLIAAASRNSNYGHREEMAAILLAYSTQRTSAETSAAVQTLETRLTKKPTLGSSRVVVGGRTITPRSGPRNYRRYASALLRLQPEPAVAMRAHSYLLEHGLVHEQSVAIDRLRNDATALRAAERILIKLAAHQGTNRALRNEVVTTIGMLAKPTQSSIECLQALANSKDKELSARAKAALRGH